VGAGQTRFRLDGIDGELALRVPGEHNVLNAAAAIAALTALTAPIAPAARRDGRGGVTPGDAPAEALAEGLWSFTGTRRRSEIIGERGGVLYVDDYAHHPTAISATLKGMRAFYPGRRIIVSFMSHTYSRTAGLLEDFAAAFGDADIVITHKIYASAREHFDGRIGGQDLADAIARKHRDVRYVPEVTDAMDLLKGELRSGDVFISMGAGNNWVLSHRLYEGSAA
jgi:UDP-N-acetylmuramate--alanine ligase